MIDETVYLPAPPFSALPQKLCIKVGGGGMGGCYQIEINNLGKNIV